MKNKKGINYSLSMISNKRGQGMNINAIIKIVLGVALMALLMWGVYIVWTKFSSQTTSDNVAEVVNGCQVACASEGKYDYCTKTRTLIDADKATKDLTLSCAEYSKTYTQYGIAACPAITCDVPVAATP